MAPVPLRIKICCMASADEARLAARHGADAVGLVSAMPSGPGPIADDVIASIAAAAPRHLRTFLLTSRTDVVAIAEQVRRAGTTTVQLVDDLTRGTHADLRALLPGIELVQVIHVRDESSVGAALEVAPAVDALLLDSGNPALAVKELGGTGRTHDWRLSRRIVEGSPVPVWLAGGLGAHNATDAVAAVGPYGLDICSGVRTDGRLDEAKLAAFVAAARRGGAAPAAGG